MDFEMNYKNISDLANCSPDDIEWQVWRILPRRGLVLISGHPGIGKTLCAIDLAIILAKGEHWMGRFRTEKCRVCIVDQENDEISLGTQIRKVFKAKGILGDKIDVDVMNNVGVNFSDEESIQEFSKYLQERQPGAVIIDPFIMFHGANENSAVDMSGVFRNMRQVMQENSCSIIALDHNRKPQSGEADTKFSFRGSSAKSAAVDCHLMLAEKGKYVEVSQVKSRFSERLSPWLFKIQRPTKKTVVLEYMGKSKEVLGLPMDYEVGQFVLNMVLTSVPNPSRQEVIDEGKKKGFSTQAVDQALQHWEHKGRIQLDDRKLIGKKGRTRYYLPKEAKDEGKTEQDAA